MSNWELPIKVCKPCLASKEAFLEYAGQIWENHWLTNGGPIVHELERRLSQTLDVPHIVVFANGHLALDSAFKALGLTEGEAITTPFTYISTTNAISMNGMKPVFCDIKESDCTIDEDKIEALITEKTRAIVPVHVYGFPCNYKKIQEIADRHQLKVIYDAAHTFGVKVDGQGIGSFGDASMFSFHATKVFNTVEGGGVSFSDPALESKLIAAKTFGLSQEDAKFISFNAKMTEFHAAMGLANLDIFPDQIRRRKEAIAHYLDRLSGIDGIRVFSWDKPGVEYNYAYFPVIFDERVLGVGRDTIADRLAERYGIMVRKYFYPLISQMSCYISEHNPEDTPIAKAISERVLTLPLYADLDDNQVDYICDGLKRCINE